MNHRKLCPLFHWQPRNELQSICKKVLQLLETVLLPNAEPGEAKTFYLKMQGDPWRVSMCFGQQLLVKAEDSNARFRQITVQFFLKLTAHFSGYERSSNCWDKIIWALFAPSRLFPSPFLWACCPKRFPHISTCFDLSPHWKNTVSKYIVPSTIEAAIGPSVGVWENALEFEAIPPRSILAGTATGTIHDPFPSDWIFFGQPSRGWGVSFSDASLSPWIYHSFASLCHISPFYSSLHITYILTCSPLDFEIFPQFMSKGVTLPHLPDISPQCCNIIIINSVFFSHRFLHMNLTGIVRGANEDVHLCSSISVCVYIYTVYIYTNNMYTLYHPLGFHFSIIFPMNF